MKTTQKTRTPLLTCLCGATAKNTSKEAPRFRRRHLKPDTDPKSFEALEHLEACKIGSIRAITRRNLERQIAQAKDELAANMSEHGVSAKFIAAEIRLKTLHKELDTLNQQKKGKR